MRLVIKVISIYGIHCAGARSGCGGWLYFHQRQKTGEGRWHLTLQWCNSAEKSIRSIVKLDPHVIMRVKVHTLTYMYVLLNIIHTNFTCVSHATELIKTIINRYALIRIKYETSKLIPNHDNMRRKLSRLVLFSHFKDRIQSYLLMSTGIRILLQILSESCVMAINWALKLLCQFFIYNYYNELCFCG